MTDYVIDGLGMIHSRANWEALRPNLSPAWLQVLGPGRPVSMTDFSIPVVADPSMPRNTLELRSGSQRVRVRWVDEAEELDRWASDGGAVP